MTAPDKYAEKAKELFESRIGSMCMTWDHSFGLMEDYRREGLRAQFRQVGRHDIIPVFAQALREAEAEGMRRAAEIAFTRRLPVTEAADGSIQRMLRAFGNEVRGVVVDDIRKAILSQAGGE